MFGRTALCRHCALPGTWAAEGLCPSACTIVPLTFGPTFCFRALVPGLVAREVFTSHGHRPLACARLSFGIGSHLQCPPSDPLPHLGLGSLVCFPCFSHTPLLAKNPKACRWSSRPRAFSFIAGGWFDVLCSLLLSVLFCCCCL